MSALRSTTFFALAFLLLTSSLAIPKVWAGDEVCPAGPVFTDDYAGNDGFDFETLAKYTNAPTITDIEWNSTGYMFGGHGLISGAMDTGGDIIYRSRFHQISETDIGNLTLSTCSSLAYTVDDQIISDGEILCIAYDMDENGTYDDLYAAVRLNSHIDDVSGDFAASANLSIIVLQTDTPDVCDDSNPCTVDSCDLDGNCSFVTDLALCSETLSPCEGPEPGVAWENHGGYMSQLAQSTQDAVKAGHITKSQRGEIMMSGAESTCGQ